MDRRYVFSNPEQLKEITIHCKESSAGKVMNVAKIWSVNSRQKEKTPWDGKIYASFHTDGHERKAYILRTGMESGEHVIGQLKYNAGLKWCKEHLKAAV